jgi:hypothetical protein
MTITITWEWWQIALAIGGIVYAIGAAWAFRWSSGCGFGLRIRMILFWPLTLLAAMFGTVQ